MAQETTNGSSTAGRIRGYFEDSRNLATSYLFILPVLVAYEIGIQLSGAESVNAVGAGFQFLAERIGHNVLNVLFVVGFFAAYVYNQKTQGRTNYWHIAPVMLEGLTWAFLIGIFAWAQGSLSPNAVADLSLDRTTVMEILLSLGAGVYEETLFRLVLIAVLLWLARMAMSRSDPDEHTPFLVAILTSAVLFALAHHVWIEPDWSVYLLDLNTSAMVFRTVCGVIFATVYLMRGFAVVVYAHAFYDVLAYLHNASL